MLSRNLLKQIFTTAGLVGCGLIVLSRQAVADGNKCFNVQANQNVTVTSATTTTGTITQGGTINGTTANKFSSALTPTPDPNTFSFTDQLTITTRGGKLTDNDVTIVNNTLGVFSTISPISNGTESLQERPVLFLYLVSRLTAFTLSCRKYWGHSALRIMPLRCYCCS
jgi:hypothetical protein